MKNITTFINEASNKVDQWVAVEVTTAADHYHSKDTTSQRVVSYDTYLDMKETRRTKGMMSIKYIEKIGPVCKTKEQAMEFIDAPQKKMRTSKINKGDADYIVWCISSGTMNAAGKTKWESFENFWETWKDGEIYMGHGGAGRSFLMGAPGSLKVGDKVCCVDNDTQKKLAGAPKKIDAVCKCNLEDFRKVFRETYPEICKAPKRAFGKVSDGLPWTNRMGQFYSIKGIGEE